MPVASSALPRTLQQKKEIALFRIVIFPDEDHTTKDWTYGECRAITNRWRLDFVSARNMALKPIERQDLGYQPRQVHVASRYHRRRFCVRAAISTPQKI